MSRKLVMETMLKQAHLPRLESLGYITINRARALEVRGFSILAMLRTSVRSALHIMLSRSAELTADSCLRAEWR